VRDRGRATGSGSGEARCALAQAACRASAFRHPRTGLPLPAQRDELRLQVDIALGDRRTRIDAAKRAYNLLYPRLQLTFPDDAALVEPFFRRLSDARAEEKPEPTEPTGPTEP
jgi:hypothetical protein